RNDTKAIPGSKQLEGPHSPNKKRHKRQLFAKYKNNEVKPKEHTEPKSQPKHPSDTRSKHAPKEKAVSKSSEQPPSEKSTKPKTKSQDEISGGGKSAVPAVATAASAEPADKNKESKLLTSAVPVESKPSKPSAKSDMDTALDDLIDTLGEPEETKEDTTTYTGPEVSDPMSSTYIEELGKREVTLPPKYRELLNKEEGIAGPPPDSSKPLGPNDAIDALSSDFTCSSPTADAKKTEKEKSTEEALKAQSAGVIRSAAPPKEKRRKVEEDTMTEQALEALSASLGTRKPEPELDLSSIKEVDEAKAREEKVKKCGEDEETVPSEYRLKPATDKDGKPLLPEAEEKPKKVMPMADRVADHIVGSLLSHFNNWVLQKSFVVLLLSVGTPGRCPRARGRGRASDLHVFCAVGSTHSSSSDDAVEALAGSLGKKEADPEDGKPVEDKVKEKAKEEDREKLGEREETIPPDYRLEEAKDKDGKPLPPKEVKEPLPPLSEDFLLDALSKDFTVPSDTSSPQFEDAKLSAVISEVVSQTPAPTTQAAGPPRDSARDNKELDDALDQLSDSLGQRQPDPDENKPVEDKVKEKAKAEHRDKLGERDDTIPPKYQHLLDDNKEVSEGGVQGGAIQRHQRSPRHQRNLQVPRTPLTPSQGTWTAVPQLQKPQQTQQRYWKPAPSDKAPRNGGKAKDSTKVSSKLGCV
uniref:Calpastatin n=1 Tax=Capra hircus TaxID=9925 RepID=A0A452GAV9_CAPHI